MSPRTICLLSCLCIVSSLTGCQLTTTGKNGYNGNWAPLFDGTSLAGWKQSDFLNPGVAYARDRKLTIPAGEVMSGITWAGDFPKNPLGAFRDRRCLFGHEQFQGVEGDGEFATEKFEKLKVVL